MVVAVTVLAQERQYDVGQEQIQDAGDERGEGECLWVLLASAHAARLILYLQNAGASS